MKLLIIFIILNIVNVILQTIKSLATVKCGKGVAALVNAIAYGLYTVVIVYTNCDLPLSAKVAVTAVTNLIGVYTVKYFEEKARKDKLWKVEATVRTATDTTSKYLEEANIPYSIIPTVDGKHRVYNIYCATQAESATVKDILAKQNAKYFVSESKIL